MATFTQDQKFRFDLGEWVECESSNVSRVRYDYGGKVLIIQYHDGSYYEYPLGPEEADDFASAASKGKWRHQHLPTTRAYKRVFY